jgi:hypothetical protein
MQILILLKTSRPPLYLDSSDNPIYFEVINNETILQEILFTKPVDTNKTLSDNVVSGTPHHERDSISQP